MCCFFLLQHLSASCLTTRITCRARFASNRCFSRAANSFLPSCITYWRSQNSPARELLRPARIFFFFLLASIRTFYTTCASRQCWIHIIDSTCKKYPPKRELMYCRHFSGIDPRIFFWVYRSLYGYHLSSNTLRPYWLTHYSAGSAIVPPDINPESHLICAVLESPSPSSQLFL